MSETLSQDPESLGSGYGLASNYPPTPATPSSTVQDPPGSNLPPFSTFSADMDTASGFATDRFLSDTRLLDISNWEYYPEARILERTENGLSIIASQPQYRPWESKPVDSTFAPTAPVTTFADAFAQNGVSKLPSFQSQFQTFNEPVTTTEPTTLTTLTNLTPVSPNSSSPTLTTLNPANFHTLNPRNYPLVPAPIQAREIPSIQQQFLDERHIQLYTHPTANIATLNPAGAIFQPQNGAIIQGNQLLGSPTVVTVIKSEPDLKLIGASNLTQDTGLKIQSLHPTHFQNPMSTMMDNNGLYNGLDKKLNGMNAALGSPTRNDFRKKERRKMRASSLESSAESDGASSNMEIGSESSGQVAAVSSTASFKSHHAMPANSSLEVDEISGGNVDKQVKKKRKRCGECIGCQRKDNCGDCAPCRNDKSHQICKQRRCEKLTEKKNLYGDQSYIRGESRRGRGKGRGAGSYRGRKPSGPVSLSNTPVPEPSVPSSRPSPQPIHMLKPEQPVQQQQQQQQPMAPMPFYADPTRFSTPVWQTEPAAQTWSQGQFIQQISASAQPTLEAYPPQQYPNGIYPATYQQPAAFETGTFYTGVQVLTNTVRPPSAQQLTPRANGSYSHTPSPVPQQQAQPQPTAQRSNISGQYHQEYVNNQGYVAPTTPTGGGGGGGGLDNSRPSSVNSTVNVPTPGQNFQQQQQSGNFTSVSSTNFSPGSANANPNFGGSGNEKPGYPQVNSSPRLVSHSSSGYPGDEYSGSIQSEHWPVVNSENMLWEPPSIGQQNLEGAKSNPEHGGEDQFSQSSRVNLNSRIKTMILNKQQNVDRKSDEEQQQNHGEGDDKTGHFLWYSHHRRPPDLIGGGGGVPSPTSDLRNLLLDRSRHGFRDESKSRRDTGGHNGPPLAEKRSPRRPGNCFAGNDVNCESEDNKIKNNSGADIPHCNCFPPDKMPPEPGSYYAHLGCASSLVNLRKDLETRTGASGPAIRIEKICYTGKEGKTAQGCPLAKWIIRRANPDEKYLILVKHRQGHACTSAYIVVCIVAWEGVSLVDTDSLYATLADKLNSFGVATNRRCATNEQRTCACQGLDPKTCGASFSFGCSWSMYYNGCKFARSKVVRKFRLAEKSEEENVERKLQSLATQVAPLYRILAPDSFKNQCDHEDAAGDCRLGSNRGRPFSGVTACMDFCAHAHKDSHNMNNGCTVVVSLTKERSLSKPEDEQLHVLPLYTVDGTDELGSKENQDAKIRSGSIEILKRYECEVRVRTVPLQPCRRRKKKEEDPSLLKESPLKRDSSGTSSGYDSSRSQTPQTPGKNMDGVLQSDHISSTVLDSPKSWTYDNYYYYDYQDANDFPTYSSVLTQDKANATAFNFTYPKPRAQNILLQNKVQDSYSGIRIPNRIPSNGGEYNNFGVEPPRPEVSPYDFRYKPDANAPFKIPQTPPQELSARLFHGNFLPYPPSNTSYPSENLLQQTNNDDFGYNPPGFVRNNHWDVWRNHSIADTSRIIQESLLPRSPSAWCRARPSSSSPFQQHDVALNYQLCNPFDDFGDYGLKRAPDCGYFSPPTPWSSPKSNWDVPRETLGKVTDVVDNAESFRDSQVGGVAIALGHGSVLFECAKHELHATTALKKPNRTSPTRISLVFYQHRNLNRPRHGWDQWEEKNKLKKLGLNDVNLKLKLEKIEVPDLKALVRKNNAEILLRAPTLTTMSVTTLFPMYPCMVTGPYQEAHSFG